jgi:transcriptional regulator with XRE-family HTH domain
MAKPDDMASSHRGDAKRAKRNPSPLVRAVVARLNAEIEARGLNPTTVARITGLDQGNLSRVLRGGSPMVSFELVAAVAAHLDLSLDALAKDGAKALAKDVGKDGTKARQTTPPPSSAVLSSRRP